MKKSIFFDGTPLINKYISGVGSVLLETLRAFDTAKYNKKYSIYVFVPFNEVSKMRQFNFIYIKVKALPYPHKLHSLFSRMKYAPPIDIFLGRGVYIFENYRNWNLLFSKSLTYFHDVAFKVFPDYIQEENLRYLEKYSPLWIHRADKLITVSDTAKKEIEEKFSLQGVEVVKNAVNTDLFYPRTMQEIAKLQKKWSIPNDYFVVLGNLEPRKNIEATIAAFNLYNRNREAHLLIIGGDGWKNKGILKTIQKGQNEGAIIRPSSYIPDEDLPGLLSGAIALIQMSWHEGFGLPVVQALACGTPVVASDIPVLREAVVGNMNRVVFAHPDKKETIVNAITQVENIKHQTVPKNIRTWRESAGDLDALIESL